MMSGRDVKIWQRFLRDDGHYSGPIDGIFGKGTRRAGFEAANARCVMIDHNSTAQLDMVNHKATRNKRITEVLKSRIIESVTAVYGGGCRISVYSGGQMSMSETIKLGGKKGKGGKWYVDGRPVRTGSVRHDDFGDGGRAADCYIYVEGKKISGIELAKLGQFWLAKGYGACGLEMATGGIHLDEWTTPPKGGGMFWTYKYSDRKPWGKSVKLMLVSGNAGHFPK